MRSSRVQLFLLICGVFLLASCQTVPESVPEDLSSAELLQRAQEFADKANYEAALLYLDALDQRYASERMIVVVSQYHRALYLDQSGDYDAARQAYHSLLLRYETEGDLPSWIQVLVQRRLDILPQALSAEETE